MYRYSLMAQGQVTSSLYVQIGTISAFLRGEGLSVIIKDSQRATKERIAGEIPLKHVATVAYRLWSLTRGQRLAGSSPGAFDTPCRGG
ncbi:hypothetical protein TNCV_1140891 [Trichonephila clavipes]|nr:hypothetical protein TNCV_1140891 [Trichonephila clavipes]